MHVCWCTCHGILVEIRGQPSGDKFFLPHVDLAVKYRSSGLMASTFTCWVISLTLLPLFISIKSDLCFFFNFLSSLVFYFMPSNMSNFFSEYQWATSREQNHTPSERAYDVVPVFQFDELYPSYKKGNMCYRHVPSVSSLLLQPWWQWVVKLLNLCLKSLNPFSKSRKIKIKERLK